MDHSAITYVYDRAGRLRLSLLHTQTAEEYAADSTLVQAESPAAQYVEIHEMVMDNDVMKIRQIPRLALPAGQAVELKPGGYHIMLIGLKEQVHEDNHVPITLTFESPDGKRETVNIEASVRPLASGSPSGGHHHKY